MWELLKLWQFRSTGSYEPDPKDGRHKYRWNLFRSTGSYEPDQGSPAGPPLLIGFDPQALTSLTRWGHATKTTQACFDPQALTSLTLQGHLGVRDHHISFDPQALTSLTC